MTIRLHHIGLAVGDVDAILEALVEAFGAVRSEAPVAGHVLLQIAGVHLALVPLSDADPKARAWGDHLALRLPQPVRDQAVSVLRARGWASEDVRGRIYVRSGDGSLTLELLAD